MKQKKIRIDFAKHAWRYEFTKNFFEIIEAKQVKKTIWKKCVIYSTVANIMGFQMIEKSTTLSEKFTNYEKMFFQKKTHVFNDHKKNDHVINIRNIDFSYGSLYNLLISKLQILRKNLDDVLSKKWIRHSISSAEASIFFVSKKNGGLRLCVDYWELNKIMRKNQHFFSLITQILNQLNGAKYFIKLGLKNAYHRIRIWKGDEWKTTFQTTYGHFEYQIMSFELANASVTFQTYINKVLSGLIDTICVVYLNDILIYFKNRNSHVKHVKRILNHFKKYDLYVKLNKCEFFKNFVEYLGFIIKNNGISMNLRQIEIIRDWSELKSFKNIQIFLEFVNFYKKFIHWYSHIIMFLTNMLKDMKKNVKKKSFFMNNITK